MLLDLEDLDLKLQDACNRYAKLEAKFRPMFLQKQSGFLNDKRNGFDSKILAESEMSVDTDYGEYLQLPIQIDLLKTRSKLLNSQYELIAKKMELMRLLK